MNKSLGSNLITNISLCYDRETNLFNKLIVKHIKLHYLQPSNEIVSQKIFKNLQSTFMKNNLSITSTFRIKIQKNQAMAKKPVRNK